MKYTKTDPELPDLEYHSEGAAGIDLYAASPITIPMLSSEIIPCGVSIEIPSGHFGLVTIRSGLGFKHSLATHIGIIDSDYRGECLVKIYNHGTEPVKIKRYQRIANLVIVPCTQVKPVLVAELSSTDRGEKGFGSTGI